MSIATNRDRAPIDVDEADDPGGEMRLGARLARGAISIWRRAMRLLWIFPPSGGF